MTVRRFPVSLTTAVGGAATGYTPWLSGRLSTIRYVKTDFADGSTFTITSDVTGATIWTETGVNASATRAPRQATHSTAGVAALYAGSGTAVNDVIVLSRDRVKIAVTAAGDAKVGTFYVLIED